MAFYPYMIFNCSFSSLAASYLTNAVISQGKDSNTTRPAHFGAELLLHVIKLSCYPISIMPALGFASSDVIILTTSGGVHLQNCRLQCTDWTSEDNLYLSAGGSPRKFRYHVKLSGQRHLPRQKSLSSLSRVLSTGLLTLESAGGEKDRPTLRTREPLRLLLSFTTEEAK